MSVFDYLSRYIPVRKELKFRMEGAMGIVSNRETYKVDYLNETAVAIFTLIDGKRSIAAICDAFLADFDVDRQVFTADLIEIIRNFQWQKLITLKTS